MVKRNEMSPVIPILLIYAGLWVLRAVEYLVLRTDQSIVGEAVLHKLAGIVMLVLILRYLGLRGQQVGFAGYRAGRYLALGLLLGAGSYLLAYGAEYYLQFGAGQQPSLALYVTSYAVDGNVGHQTGALFFLLCIVGNVINVVMEEGVFRGLFVRLAESRFRFGVALAFSSLLFGLWHVVAPLRSYLDGTMSGKGAMMYALMLVVTTGLTGIKFGLLVKLTGSLWAAMADHFFNNAVINLLHIAALGGADGMQTLRITIAQTISFIVVLAFFIAKKAWQRQTFRGEPGPWGQAAFK